MTSRFVASMAFAALVISVLSLFVALSATDDTTGSATDVTEPQASVSATSAAEPAPSVSVTTATVSTDAVVIPAVTTPTTDAADATDTEATDSEETTTPLAGTPSQIGPSAGTQLGVIGVSHHDFLNVRDEPNGDIVATLTLRLSHEAGGEQSLIVAGPDAAETFETIGASGVVATGRTRDLATSTWHEIAAGPIVGWASSNYLAPLSVSTRLDMTDRVVEAAGSRPAAATLTAIADLVVAEFASDDPPSRVRITSAPRASGGVVGVTVDVVGLPDDSVRGYRLHITADAAGDWAAAAADGDIAADAGPYTLRGVAATPLCYSHRGVAENGMCN